MHECVGSLRAKLAEAEKQLAGMEEQLARVAKERDEWKANHDNQVGSPLRVLELIQKLSEAEAKLARNEHELNVQIGTSQKSYDLMGKAIAERDAAVEWARQVKAERDSFLEELHWADMQRKEAEAERDFLAEEVLWLDKHLLRVHGLQKEKVHRRRLLFLALLAQRESAQTELATVKEVLTRAAELLQAVSLQQTYTLCSSDPANKTTVLAVLEDAATLLKKQTKDNRDNRPSTTEEEDIDEEGTQILDALRADYRKLMDL